MTNHFTKFLEICPSLNLPRGEEVTGAVEIAGLGLYPRLYLIPKPLLDVPGVEGEPRLRCEDKIVWVGMEVSAKGFPLYLGYVDPTVALRGLGEPYPTTLVRSLVYREQAPFEVYVFATQTPYLTDA